MCDYDYDPATLSVWQWIRARKPRACCACEETIEARQIYHRAKYLHEGTWDSWDHCARCWAICEEIWKVNDGAGIDMRLACGEKWRDNFGLTAEPAHLAFELPGEAQERAEREYAQRSRRRETMP